MKFKGQTEVVTAVLIFGVVVSLVGATYIWGVPLIKKQQAFGNLQRDEKFMKDLLSKIESVDNGHSGAKDVMVLTEDGVFSVNTAANAVEFQTHQTGTYYILSNSTSTAWNPVAWGPETTGIYGEDAPAIIRAKAIANGDGYDVTYQILFRNLITRGSDQIYLINVTTDTTRGQDKGVTGEQVSIENIGRTQINSTFTESNLKVTVPK